MKTKKAQGGRLVTMKTINIYRDRLPYEKITRYAFENVPGLFKTFFQCGSVFRGHDHRESAIFDVILRFLEILSQKIWDGGRALPFLIHARRLV